MHTLTKPCTCMNCHHQLVKHFHVTQATRQANINIYLHCVTNTYFKLPVLQLQLTICFLIQCNRAISYAWKIHRWQTNVNTTESSDWTAQTCSVSNCLLMCKPAWRWHCVLLMHQCLESCTLCCCRHQAQNHHHQLHIFVPYLFWLEAFWFAIWKKIKNLNKF